MSLYDWLFNPSGLTPHGFCLLWAPGLIVLHAASDAIIGLAYFSIPLALASFASQRKDIEYSWIIHLFVAFILACGTTHLMSILTLWSPAYGIEGIIKAITALLSIATAVILWPLIPKLVALPSGSQLKLLNSQLAFKVDEQERTAQLLRASEAQVRRSNIELERRVEERTAELVAANAQLSQALEERDLLLREVYHRVKNNLQVIDGIVTLQARLLAVPDAKSALQGLRQRLYALGLVHQQLMSSADLKTFDVAPFLKELSANIMEGIGGRDIDLSVRAIPLDVGLDFAIPLGLLVTELVTNSLKHAFPDGKGRIEVELDRRHDGTMVLVVSDNGSGYEIRETPQKQKMSGLGTTLIQGLVSQLRAIMNVRKMNGTTCEVLFAHGVSA
ncbi:MAG TPA: histidine kinase dimerization/phosphoacceptor domain -containing protein [Rhizomicrobium sp.]|nr:histidine kinase dimerization/phosphoacceptor domain -containing protein [Rhizomicrobium sp.]